MKNARSAVSSGATIPPAFCRTPVARGRALAPRAAVLVGAAAATARSCRVSLSRRRSSRGRAPPRSPSAGTRRRSAPSYMTRIRSESESTSSSSSETSRTARPSSRSSTRRRWTNSIAPTSRPRVGCAAISTLGSRSISRATTTFCWLPPESAPAVRLRAAAADVELLDQPPRPLDQPLREEPPEARVGRLAVVVERDVLGDREVEHEAAPLAVLRDVAEAGVEVLARARRCVTSSPAERRRARSSALPQAGDRVDELGLAVAVDAGDPDDLAGAHVERDAAHLLEPAVVANVQVLDLEQRLAGRRRRLVDLRAAPRGRPSAGRGSPRSRPAAGTRLDHLPAAQHGDRGRRSRAPRSACG